MYWGNVHLSLSASCPSYDRKADLHIVTIVLEILYLRYLNLQCYNIIEDCALLLVDSAQMVMQQPRGPEANITIRIAKARANQASQVAIAPRFNPPLQWSQQMQPFRVSHPVRSRLAQCYITCT